MGQRTIGHSLFVSEKIRGKTPSGTVEVEDK